MFIDHIRVQAFAGDGGNGCVSFRREAFVPRGGPDGGDGGRGGSVVLVADVHTDNLTAFFYEPLLKAHHGQHGMGKQCYGKSAPDKVFRVPVGTLVYRVPVREKSSELEPSVRYGSESTFIDLSKAPDDAGGGDEDSSLGEMELVADLNEPGKQWVLCKGGKGGLGNVHFKSSRNQAPTQFTYGEPGETGEFYLELQTIADVGLVGYPNAGKSTLLTSISAAHPKVAAYPFTTLTPHVGVVHLEEGKRLTVADIPGLIEGAHRNVGLGHEFLRHIRRCKLLALVVDAAGSEGRDPVSDLQNLRREINLYDPTLSERPWMIVANKCDLTESAEYLPLLASRFGRVQLVEVSAMEGVGIEVFKKHLAHACQSTRGQGL
jgi:GTP-binding protein